MSNNLFNIAINRGVVDVDTVLNKVNKAKQLTKNQTELRTGDGSLIQTIASISDSVEKYLGHKKDDYLCLTSEDEITSYIDQVISIGTVAIDTETTGLDPMVDDIVGMSLYARGLKAAYIPITHISYVTHKLISGQPTKEFLKVQLDRLVEADTKVIMFNAGFDLRILRQSLNVYMHCWYDASLAAFLLNENEPENQANLKALHKKYVLHGAEDEFRFGELFKNVTFSLVPIEAAYLYGARDAEITFELCEFQYPFLDPNNRKCINKHLQDVANVFWNIEMPCIEVLADMEDRGVCVDLETCNKLKDKYIPLLKSKEAAFNKLLIDNGITEPINVASPQQLSHLLYDILNLKSPDRKNPRGTGGEILDALDHPIVDAIKEYKDLAKLVSAFVIKLPDVVNKNDGRIHCSYKQLGAKTGRMSCNNPNLQQVPSHVHDIRQMFTASPGYVLIGSDFSQQEPKLMSFMSNDKELMERAKEGKDVYATIAAIAFNTTYENCLEFYLDENGNKTTQVNKEGKARRNKAKVLVLGISYGMGIPSIAKKLNCSTEEAEKIFNAVLDYCKGLNSFIEDSKKMAKEKGYVTTLWGSRRRLPDIQLPQYTIKYSQKRIEQTGVKDVSAEDLNYYSQKLSQIKYRRDFYDLRKSAESQGVLIYDNSSLISGAERQCINARIQGCLAGHTRIQTKEFGIVPVKSVVGQKVTVWDGEGWSYSIVTDSGHKQKCIITFTNKQQIVCSPDHKFLTVNTNGNLHFKKCSELKFNDRIKTTDIYEHSDKLYESNEFVTNSHNANMFHIDQISDHYIAGRMLGRIASDGSISNSERRGKTISLFVAEHEKDVLDYFKSSLPYKYTIKENTTYATNNPRNQRMYSMNIYSTALVNEISNLDIKHHIPQEIWNDTEMLRGFLSGLFDGDGSASGDHINLTFGLQHDFYNYIKEIQQALLFFGVRSRIYKYADRYTVSIFKKDCQKFANQIGFINAHKQKLAQNISPVFDEHVYGSNLRVSSVEITEDKIPMYDVCNTERGRFVADGMIVHNSASLMTKTAMIKIANDSILKDLDFHLLLQVHDELIGECPYENRKAVAERFGYLMANCVKDEIPIPFSTDVSCVERWYGDEIPLND